MYDTDTDDGNALALGEDDAENAGSPMQAASGLADRTSFDSGDNQQQPEGTVNDNFTDPSTAKQALEKEQRELKFERRREITHEKFLSGTCSEASLKAISVPLLKEWAKEIHHEWDDKLKKEDNIKSMHRKVIPDQRNLRSC